MYGQDSHETNRSGSSWVTKHRQANASPPSVPDGEQIRGKTRVWSIGVRVTPYRKPCGTNPVNGHYLHVSNHLSVGDYHVTIGMMDATRLWVAQSNVSIQYL